MLLVIARRNDEAIPLMFGNLLKVKEIASFLAMTSRESTSTSE
jgi:hypothetical protein